ncbi:MAG: hypothetical protein ACK5V4_06540, partial [Alphaproteobacteria bacterium]
CHLRANKLSRPEFDYNRLPQLISIVKHSKSLQSLSISVDTGYTFLQFLNVQKLNTAVENSTSLTYVNYPSISEKAKITVIRNKLRVEGKNLLLECIDALEETNYTTASLGSRELQTLLTNLADINKYLQDCNKNSISMESVQDAISAKNTNSTSSYALLMGFAAISAAAAIKVPSMVVRYASQIQEFHISSIEI